MKKISKFCLFFVFLFVSVFFYHSIRTFSKEKVYCNATIKDNFSCNEILVTLNNKADSNKVYKPSNFSEINCIEAKEITKNIRKNNRDINRIFKLVVPASNKKELLSKIYKLEEREDIYSASPNYYQEFSSIELNDCQSSQQWALSQISLHDAWHISTGSVKVNVGIIDTGIDWTHPDLKNNIDTQLSVDFSKEAETGEAEPLVDRNGHGTHVAGIIGAVGNNNIGISGVCWNINLISIKISNSKYYDFSRLVDALLYAEEQKIPLLNLSSTSLATSPDFQKAVEQYSGLLICGAGNDGKPLYATNSYPSNFGYDHILSVGSSDKNDKKCGFSNYSKNQVDVFAPGEDILSTYPLALDSSGYKVMSGTSMATPYVTGLAALIKSYKPHISREGIKSTIMIYSDLISDLESCCVSGGRINAKKALESLVHSHKFDYRYYNNRQHILTCSCGLTEGSLEAHTVRKEDILMPFAFCMDCHGRLDLRTDIGQGILSLSPKVTTYNGSYYLPNGILVLVSEDINDYFLNKLTFLDPKDK